MYYKFQSVLNFQAVLLVIFFARSLGVRERQVYCVQFALVCWKQWETDFLLSSLRKQMTWSTT